MNWPLIGHLIQFRYQLLWAKTRSRNGKIALFAIGWLLFLLISALLAAGGLGAGILAIRSGQAEPVAQIVLSGLFLNALLVTVIAGFGMGAVFSETELRRYPIGAPERFLARHILGIADPFWFFILAVEISLAVGLYLFGPFSFWNATVAVVLLFLCSYLSTRVLTVWIDRLMASPSGYTVVFLLLIAGIMATMLLSALRHGATLPRGLLAALHFTPPFAAAAAMTHHGAEALSGLAILTGWLIVLLALLVFLERLPAPGQSTQRDAGPLWDSPLDRIAALFPPRNSPLIGFWLRFYLRNNRFRVLYCLSLPVAAFIAVGIGQPRKLGGSLFVGVFGCLGIVTFAGAARIAANQFGYTAGGFRRFFLFPDAPGASLRTGSYTALLLGSLWLPPAAIIWAFFAPRPFDAHVFFMPVINAVTALFFFHSLALWTSLYAPKRGNYNKIFGNDMSLLGNIALIGTILGSALLPGFLRASDPHALDPANWWLTLPATLVAAIFYLLSLRFAGALLSHRREALLAALEGKS